ncbi:major facilitator superfamily transporter [Alcanivorax xiamenensis]|uniref:Multidrug efflux pump Tap n=1 Tax=Alcanivorax xiamenensis TaxID=1177156 RepID=A0ABQ6YE48_9GAMM|nr:MULTISPECIES: MFS transporter [Alcanivorax]KAF0808328.1 major facilitator superfamily transporter [Alcanivorax xiamenensis]
MPLPSADAGPRVYQHPGFVPFVLARLGAALAMQVQAIIVAWQVYALTRDPLSLGYVGLAQFLPMVVLLLPAGDLVDRFDRRLILHASWAAQAVCSALLIVLSLNPPAHAGPFYVVLVLFGAARAFTGPTLQSLLPQIVPQAILGKAIALNSSIMKIAVIGGPMLGGFLYPLGATTAYSVVLGCFLFALAMLFLVPIRYRQRPLHSGDTTSWQRFTAGILYIRDKPVILGIISLDLFAVLFGGVVALLPIYADEILHVGSEGLGALRSAIALGAFVMGLYLGVRAIRQHTGLVMFAAVAIFGVANLVFALSTSFWLSLAALFIAGAADMISVYVRLTLLQLATPDEMRGRVNAVNMLFIGASNELGEFESGITASWFGTVPAAVIGGVGTLAVVGLWMWGFPVLRQVDRLEDVAVEDGQSSVLRK